MLAVLYSTVITFSVIRFGRRERHTRVYTHGGVVTDRPMCDGRRTRESSVDTTVCMRYYRFFGRLRGRCSQKRTPSSCPPYVLIAKHEPYKRPPAYSRRRRPRTPDSSSLAVSRVIVESTLISAAAAISDFAHVQARSVRTRVCFARANAGVLRTSKRVRRTQVYSISRIATSSCTARAHRRAATTKTVDAPFSTVRLGYRRRGLCPSHVTRTKTETPCGSRAVLKNVKTRQVLWRPTCERAKTTGHDDQTERRGEISGRGKVLNGPREDRTTREKKKNITNAPARVKTAYPYSITYVCI